MVCGCCKRKREENTELLGANQKNADGTDEVPEVQLTLEDKMESNIRGPPAIAPAVLPPYVDESIFTTHGKGLIDFVLAYQPLEMDAAKTLYREIYEQKLHNQGLYLEYEDLAQSQDGKTCFVKIHTPWETLSRMAEVNRMKMPIKANDIEDPEEMRTNQMHYKCVTCCCFCSKGHCSELEQKYFIPQETSHFTLEFQRSKFRQYMMQEPNTFFSQCNRIQIVWDILERTMITSEDIKSHEGELLDNHFEDRQIGLISLLDEKVYVAAYPLHDGEVHLDENDKKVKPAELWPIRPWLYETWARPGRWRKFQPLDQIRKYFGEKVGFYFCWLGFYTRFLIPLTIVGFLCVVYGVINMATDPAVKDLCEGELSEKWICRACPEMTCPFKKVKSACRDAKVIAVFSNFATLFFSLFTSLWGIMFLEFWKRKQARIACRWDTMDFDTEYEQTRPEYVVAAKNKRKNPVTQEWEPFIPPRSRVQSIIVSISFVAFMVTLTLAVIASVIVYKTVMVVFYYNMHIGVVDMVGTPMFTTVTASVINAICIMILEKVYSAIAWKLTEKEFPRTDSEFEASYTYKLYIFQFINYYATLFYLAFIQGNFLKDPSHDTQLTDRCGPAGCTFSVTSQLAIVFVVKQIIQNTMEVGKPALMNWLKRRKNVAETEDNKYTRWERDFDLTEPASLELFGEYFEMIMQYGFVTMFVAAFPLAPFFALLNNVCEIRIDAYKFTKDMRRVRPERCSDIGSWYEILEFISRLSVLTNALLIAVTTDVVDRIVYMYAYSPDGSLDGYTRWTLSTFHTADWNVAKLQNGTGGVFVPHCLYRGYVSALGGGQYEYSGVWWRVTLAKFAFVLIFEHAVFFTQYVIQYLVPDIPDNVSLHQQRNRHLAKYNAYKSEMVRAAKHRGSPGDAQEPTTPNRQSAPAIPIKPTTTTVETTLSGSAPIEPSGPLYGSMASSGGSRSLTNKDGSPSKLTKRKPRKSKATTPTTPTPDADQKLF